LVAKNYALERRVHDLRILQRVPDEEDGYWVMVHIFDEAWSRKLMMVVVLVMYFMVSSEVDHELSPGFDQG
jgi:hypothetical protein